MTQEIKQLSGMLFDINRSIADVTRVRTALKRTRTDLLSGSRVLGYLRVDSRYASISDSFHKSLLLGLNGFGNSGRFLSAIKVGFEIFNLSRTSALVNNLLLSIFPPNFKELLQNRTYLNDFQHTFIIKHKIGKFW